MVASKGKSKVMKGPWTQDEDEKLLDFIQQHHHQGFSWRSIPEKTGLKRCGRSCRLRWTNYLRPDVKRGNFTIHEENTIIRLHAFIGNKWSVIAGHLTNRTDNEIKNYWRTRMKKRLTRMGIDPVTHLPKNNPGGTLSHMAQWEATRIETEARLARESKRLVQRAPPCLDVLNVWQSTSLPTSFFTSTPTKYSNQISTVKENDDHDLVVPMNKYYSTEVRGETENSHDPSMFGPVSAEYDEDINFWKYLLYLVNSIGEESPAL